MDVTKVKYILGDYNRIQIEKRMLTEQASELVEALVEETGKDKKVCRDILNTHYKNSLTEKEAHISEVAGILDIIYSKHDNSDSTD